LFCFLEDLSVNVLHQLSRETFSFILYFRDTDRTSGKDVRGVCSKITKTIKIANARQLRHTF
jgi:hypothetical protein